MAIKTPAYFWFRNSIGYISEGKGGVSSSDEQKERLRQLRLELDELYPSRPMYLSGDGKRLYGDWVEKKGPLEGEGFTFPKGYYEVEHENLDPQKTAQLLRQAHEVLQDLFLYPNVYRELGQTFAELGVEPDEELRIAIEQGTWRATICDIRPMCAKQVIEQILSTKERE